MPFTVVRKKKKASFDQFLIAIALIIRDEGQVIIEKYSEAKVKEWCLKLTEAKMPCKYDPCSDPKSGMQQWMIYRTNPAPQG